MVVVSNENSSNNIHTSILKNISYSYNCLCVLFNCCSLVDGSFFVSLVCRLVGSIQGILFKVYICIMMMDKVGGGIIGTTSAVRLKARWPALQVFSKIFADQVLKKT